MVDVPSVAAIVLHMPSGTTFTTINDKPYFAFVVSNPNIRADGFSEQEALDKLKAQILGRISSNRIFAKIVNITFGELMIEEIHNL